MAKPIRKPRKPAVKKNLNKTKKRKLQVASKMLTSVAKMGPIKRANMLAYLEKRGVKMSTDDLERACLALTQNMVHERKGQEKRFVFSAQEEASIWRQISRFVEVIGDAQKLKLF